MSDDAELPDEIFEEPARNERELTLRIVESMGEIATRAHAASQDRTITEDELRNLLEDISLDVATLFTDASRIVENGESKGPSPN